MATINPIGNKLQGVTGTGSFVGSNSPTLETPVLGTPSSGNLSGCTSYPASGLSAAIGTWTPVFTFATPGNLSVVYNNRNGYVQQIGNVFIFTFLLDITPTFTTSSGNASITGLTASAHNSTNNNYYGALSMAGTFTFPTLTTSICTKVFADDTQIYMTGCGSGQNEAMFTTANFTTAQEVFIYGTILIIS